MNLLEWPWCRWEATGPGVVDVTGTCTFVNQCTELKNMKSGRYFAVKSMLSGERDSRLTADCKVSKDILTK